MGNYKVYVIGECGREAQLMYGSIRTDNHILDVPTYMSMYYTCGEDSARTIIQ